MMTNEVPTNEVPTTDEQVRARLNDYEDALFIEIMWGLYRVYRDMGDSVKQAWYKILCRSLDEEPDAEMVKELA